MRNLFCLLVVLCCVTACSTGDNYAPVMDIATIEHVPKSGNYRVVSGETLYSIAWRYGMDYRYLARLNHIAPPFHVVAGQRIYLRGQSPLPARGTTQRNLPVNKNPVTPSPELVEYDANTLVSNWLWPAKGTIVNGYSRTNKGLNISGHLGDPIYATAGGQVVYSGNRLRGYGNLIIIKHNSHYLTAYAYNSAILVRMGQAVRAGQEIAKMGRFGSPQAILHFEIRHDGQPVNPLNYLSHS